MGCSCGGHYEWNKERQELVCVNCGKASPHQPVPSHEQLLAENERLKTRHAIVRRFLQDLIEWLGEEKLHFVKEAEKLIAELNSDTKGM